MKERNVNERHVVLVAPDVPWNTGNIARTCIGCGAHLHLIKPLGFLLDDKSLKRAGLDYWHQVKLNVWDSFDDFLTEAAPHFEEILLFSKTGKSLYQTMPVSLPRLFLVFGSETQGLPQSLVDAFYDNSFHIPILQTIRSLNLSTAVGIILYESVKTGFPAHGWAK